MFYSFFEIFDGFLIIKLALIDVPQIIVGIAVSRVDFDGLFIPFNGFFQFIHFFVENGCVVVSTMIFRIAFDTFSIICQGLLFISHIIIGNTYRIVYFIDGFVQFIDAFVSQHEIFHGFVHSSLSIISQTDVIIEIVMLNAIFFHLLFDLFVSISQSVENIA